MGVRATPVGATPERTLRLSPRRQDLLLVGGVALLDGSIALLATAGPMPDTVAIITHEDAVAAHARRIVPLRDGEIVSDVRYE